MKRMFAETNQKVFWLRLAGSLLTIALLAWLLKKQGVDTLLQNLKMISAWQLAAALILTLISRLAVSMRWYVLLRATREPVTLPQSLRLTFAGLFASNYLPTTIGGDVVRLAGAVQLGLDGARSAATLVVDRLVGMAGMVVALPWGLIPFLNSGLKLMSWIFPTAGVQWAAVAWFDPSAHPRLAKMRENALRLLRRFWDALLAGFREPRAMAIAFGFTLVHMVCTFTSVWIMLQGMGQSVPWLLVAGIWSLVYFVTLVPISINGYGLQEVIISLLYSHLGGASAEASLAVAILVRTLTMLASLPGALFVPGIIAASREASPQSSSIQK